MSSCADIFTTKSNRRRIAKRNFVLIKSSTIYVYFHVPYLRVVLLVFSEEFPSAKWQIRVVWRLCRFRVRLSRWLLRLTRLHRLQMGDSIRVSLPNWKNSRSYALPYRLVVPCHDFLLFLGSCSHFHKQIIYAASTEKSRQIYVLSSRKWPIYQIVDCWEHAYFVSFILFARMFASRYSRHPFV